MGPDWNRSSTLRGRIDDVHLTPFADSREQNLQPESVSLVADTAIQLLDVSIDRGGAFNFRQRFFEEAGDDDAEPQLHLVTLEFDGIRHPVNASRIAPNQTFAITGLQALEIFARTWLPLPVLRLRDIDTDGEPLLDVGPVNWARIYISEDAAGAPDSEGVRAVIAFDTALRTLPHAGGDGGLTPCMDDLAQRTPFMLARETEEILDFLAEDWVDNWISDAARTDVLQRHTERGEEKSDVMAHASPTQLASAAYVTLMQLLAHQLAVPAVTMIDPLAHDIELVSGTTLHVNLGQARTTAILEKPDAPVGAVQQIPEPVVVRGFCDPVEAFTSPWPSAIAFSRAGFGSDFFSRMSGRTMAFHWPSVARLGDEALSLLIPDGANETTGNDAPSGMLAPKRWIWDDAPARQSWTWPHPNQASKDHEREDVYGPQMLFVDERGNVLPEDGSQDDSAAASALFSSSSLNTFMLAEILINACAQVNAPSIGPLQKLPQASHTLFSLERIVLAGSAELLPGEKRHFLERARSAVDLVWRAMGWARGAAPGSRPVWPKPKVVLGDDDAEVALKAYLRSEIGYRFGGDIETCFHTRGRHRSEASLAPSLRLATLHIGAGVSDVQMTTAWPKKDGVVACRNELKAAVRWGCDQLLDTVTEKYLPNVMSRPGGARAELTRTIVGKTLASGILNWYREQRELARNARDSLTLRDLLTYSGCRAPVRDAILTALQSSDTSSHSLQIVVLDVSELSTHLSAVLEPALEPLARVIFDGDCDDIVLCGHLSDLPDVKDVLLRAMVTRPDRMTHVDRLAEQMSAIPHPENNKVTAMPPGHATWCLAYGHCGALHGALDIRFEGLETKAPRRSGIYIRDDTTETGNAGLAFEVAEHPERGDADRPDSARLWSFECNVPTLLETAPIVGHDWPRHPAFMLEFERGSDQDGLRFPLRISVETSGGGGHGAYRIVDAQDANGQQVSPSALRLRLQTAVAVSHGKTHAADLRVEESH